MSREARRRGSEVKHIAGRLAALTCAVLVAASCSRVPSYVIAPDDMAELMADIHIGEGVVEQNYSAYKTDSAKMALKRSIYERHGVTEQQVDTSLMWYGHNLTIYEEVYDRTIDILEKRLSEVRSTEASAAMAIAGDSVDVWSGARHLTLSAEAPSQFLTFVLDRDENWEPGDVYKWQFKSLNNKATIALSVFVDYGDGVMEQSVSSSNTDGWHSVQLTTDSLREACRIYGVTRLTLPHERGFLYLDSISLTRNRMNQPAYTQRFRQRRYGERTKLEENNAKNDKASGAESAIETKELRFVEN